MSHKIFQLSVITPEGRAYQGEVEFVALPAHDGEIGFLFDRAPLVCKLAPGRMRTRGAEGYKVWFIDGGFAQMVGNNLVVLTQKALRPEQIDRDAVRAQLDEIRQWPVADEIDAQRKAQAEIRAQAQLRIAGG